jgi:hypothetical protein
MDHASNSWWVAGLVVIWSAIIIAAVRMAQNGREFHIRRIAGLNAIDEAVGRATEMGRPILMVPGIGDIGVIVMQALSIFSYITKTAAQFGNRILLPTGGTNGPAIYTVADEVIRDSYASVGRAEAFDPDSVRFISDRQFAFAAGVAGMIYREKVAASFLFGEFFAESLIFAEAGQMVGAIQVAGTTQTTQIPFLIASCDYTIIGDEYYAASAYISREPTLLGSLAGQDVGKAIIWLLVLVGTIGLTIVSSHYFMGHGQAAAAKDFFLSRWLTPH